MNRILPERIFICGFMGAGKSTIGKALALKIEQPFCDLDTCIEERAGQTIPQLFKTVEEKGFRHREKAALLDIIRNKKGVVALGGGTLQNQHILDHIKVNGLLIFIDTPMEVMLKRIMENQERPLLLDKNDKMKTKPMLEKELRALYNQRLAFYTQADVTIKTANYSSKSELVGQLVKKIQYHAAFH